VFCEQLSIIISPNSPDATLYSVLRAIIHSKYGITKVKQKDEISSSLFPFYFQQGRTEFESFRIIEQYTQGWGESFLKRNCLKSGRAKLQNMTNIRWENVFFVLRPSTLQFFTLHPKIQLIKVISIPFILDVHPIASEGKRRFAIVCVGHTIFLRVQHHVAMEQWITEIKHAIFVYRKKHFGALEKNSRSLPQLQPSTKDLWPSSSPPIILYVNNGVEVSVSVEEKKVYKLGRAVTCTIPFPKDIKSSREHASLTYQNNYFQLLDLGSKRGCVVNGAKVGAAFLHPNDVLVIGSTKIKIMASISPKNQG